MEDTGLLSIQDVDKIVEDILHGEGGEMVADDAERRSIRMHFVNKAKFEEQRKVHGRIEGVRRSRLQGAQVDTACDARGRHRDAERWVAQEFKWMDVLDSEHYGRTLGLTW